MNQKQRELLVQKMKEQVRRAENKHEESKPSPPSLNNYLVAAALDGSLKVRDSALIAKDIQNLALSLGPNGALIDYSSRYHRNEDEKGEGGEIHLSPRMIFEIPEKYEVAWRQYQKDLLAWSEKKNDLREILETVELKILLGTSDALAHLIEQASNLADINLVNGLLKIGPSSGMRLLSHREASDD
jgi:hypothetical protein